MGRGANAWFQLRTLVQWSARMARDQFRKPKGSIHLMFCMTDHYEPGTGHVSPEEERARMELLLSEYPKLADAHRDSDNRPPGRSWFFPPHYHRRGNLRDLVSLCAKGYGEVEMHLHHGKVAPDTEENLKATIEQIVTEYSEFGIFGTEDGQKRYGFIHGDWALDNSRGNTFCGVNSEITILKNTGCYADFTFPSMNESNPLKINSIFYATDDPKLSKSHNTGKNVVSNGGKRGDLMIVEGPTHPYFLKPGIKGLRMIGDSVDNFIGPTTNRIDHWVKAGIHVEGKRNWVIVKVHTHGGADAKAVLGKQMDDAFTYMEQNYNDGKLFALHYVTARELYNIIKAVESGETGSNPNEYRNYKVAPPKYNPTAGKLEASERLQSLLARTYNG